jgi:hypothetical protein
METVVIIAPHDCLDELRSRIAGGLKVRHGADGRLVIERGSSRAYLGRDDLVRQEYGPDELRRILVP